MSHYRHNPEYRRYNHFKHLHVPEGWEQYWSKYPNGYSILEALINWTSQVNSMVDRVNDNSDSMNALSREVKAFEHRLTHQFKGFKEETRADTQAFKDEVHTIINQFIESIESTIQDDVVSSLTGWLSDGTLADIINYDVFDMKADKTELEAVESQLTHTTEKVNKLETLGEFRLQSDGEYENITQKINDAVDYLLANYGGGRIIYPSGNFYAEGIKAVDGIYHEGNGESPTRLRPPLTQTKPIFISDGVDLKSGGIKGFEIDGVDGTHNGVDLSDNPRALSYSIIDNYIHHCAVGVYSSQNDRQLVVERNRFWDNDIGYYVVLNHPLFQSCDFRNNRIGLSGDRLYDIQMNGTRFVRNDYGIKADGSFRSSHLTGVLFFSNYEVALEVNDDMNINGCLFVPPPAEYEESQGIRLVGKNINLTNSTFRKDGGHKFDDTAIKILNGEHINISNNMSNLNGTFLDIPFYGSVNLLSFAFNNNNLTGVNIKLKSSPDIAVGYSSFNHNKFILDEATNMSDSVVHIPKSVYGCDFIGNTFVGIKTAIVDAPISVDARNSIITFNSKDANFGDYILENQNSSTIFEKNINVS